MIKFNEVSFIKGELKDVRVIEVELEHTNQFVVQYGSKKDDFWNNYRRIDGSLFFMNKISAISSAKDLHKEVNHRF